MVSSSSPPRATTIRPTTTTQKCFFFALPTSLWKWTGNQPTEMMEKRQWPVDVSFDFERPFNAVKLSRKLRRHSRSFTAAAAAASSRPAHVWDFPRSSSSSRQLGVPRLEFHDLYVSLSLSSKDDNVDINDGDEITFVQQWTGGLVEEKNSWFIDDRPIRPPFLLPPPSIALLFWW